MIYTHITKYKTPNIAKLYAVCYSLSYIYGTRQKSCAEKNEDNSISIDKRQELLLLQTPFP